MIGLAVVGLALMAAGAFRFFGANLAPAELPNYNRQFGAICGVIGTAAVLVGMVGYLVGR